jgi:oligosaccharide repeat unit polymerase
MNNYEFYALILNNTYLFLILVVGSLLLHYAVFRYQVHSILDPFFLAVISSAFCMADVILLYATSQITNYIFISYLLTQFAFILGLFTFGVKRKWFSENQKHNSGYKSITGIFTFYFFSSVYLLSQSAIYVLKGIPLFMQSRLETFADGGGTGVLGRVTDVCSVFSIYLFFSVIKIDKLRFSEFPKYLILALIFTTFLLSGSKASFLTVFNIFWCYIVFAYLKGRDYMGFLRILKKSFKPILLFCLIFVIGIIFIQSSDQIDNPEDRLNPMYSLALRFVHSGDVYWYAYANDVYLTIPGDRWFAALFNDTLGFLRIANWDTLPEAIGITLKNIHHPSDIPQGPNGRHNVFGLIYYGFWGSICFSFLLGVFLSFVRNKLHYFLKYDNLGGFIFTYLMLKIANIDSDPMLTVTYITNIVFIFPILYIIYLIVLEFFSSKTMIT